MPNTKATPIPEINSYRKMQLSWQNKSDLKNIETSLLINGPTQIMANKRLNKINKLKSRIVELRIDVQNRKDALDNDKTFLSIENKLRINPNAKLSKSQLKTQKENIAKRDKLAQVLRTCDEITNLRLNDLYAKSSEKMESKISQAVYILNNIVSDINTYKFEKLESHYKEIYESVLGVDINAGLKFKKSANETNQIKEIALNDFVKNIFNFIDAHFENKVSAEIVKSKFKDKAIQAHLSSLIEFKPNGRANYWNDHANVANLFAFISRDKFSVHLHNLIKVKEEEKRLSEMGKSKKDQLTQSERQAAASRDVIVGVGFNSGKDRKEISRFVDALFEGNMAGLRKEFVGASEKFKSEASNEKDSVVVSAERVSGTEKDSTGAASSERVENESAEIARGENTSAEVASSNRIENDSVKFASSSTITLTSTDKSESSTYTVNSEPVQASSSVNTVSVTKNTSTLFASKISCAEQEAIAFVQTLATQLRPEILKLFSSTTTATDPMQKQNAIYLLSIKESLRKIISNRNDLPIMRAHVVEALSPGKAITKGMRAVLNNFLIAVDGRMQGVSVKQSFRIS